MRTLRIWMALLGLFLMAIPMLAQSKYVSYTPVETEDRIADLGGKGGVLILSKRNDLVVSVTNARSAVVTPKGKRSDGLFEYIVAVSKDETPNPKMEVSRRGDINRTKFVAKIRPNFLRAYLIDEVEKPIMIEDQSSGNDAILDASLAEVELISTISDLKVVCDKSLGATISTSRKKSDNSVIVTSVKIPVASIQNAKAKLDNLVLQRDALSKKLQNAKNGNASNAEWERLDMLEEDVSNAEKAFRTMCTIDVYGLQTNHLPIDVSGMGPRSKQVYGVLLLKTVVKEYVSECSGMLSEGGRLFSLREYDAAKRIFYNALKAKDTPSDIIPTIHSNIAQCDTCILYERLVSLSMQKMQEMKKNGTGTQNDVVEYASSVIEFMGKLEAFNPCEFYESRIKMLSKAVADMPLDLRFTLTRWQKSYEGFAESGMLPNVELWAFYGESVPGLNEYDSDRKFRNMVSSSEYKQLGTSDEMGIIDLHLVRKDLPRGFFFRPVGYEGKRVVKYVDMADVMAQSKNEHNKRQFRLKMYVDKK